MKRLLGVLIGLFALITVLPFVLAAGAWGFVYAFLVGFLGLVVLSQRTEST